MNENIDNSTKFERYALLNNLYGKIYNYEHNIKPAPNPFYILDKYYGSLSINEYRKLLHNDRLLIVVDKPLTKSFPELHEENIDILSNASTAQYRLKRKKPVITSTPITESFHN